MEGDAQRDAENLRNRLDDLLARPALGEEDRLLAEYLLERENSLSSSDDHQGHLEVLPQFCIAKGGYPTIGEHIGHGAVYKVKWLGMTCAKKHFSATEEEGLMMECKKEVSVLATLNHPHIVKLLCTSEQSEVSFLMELMPMSLSDFIRELWKWPQLGIVPAAAIDMMLQIARGMEYLHEHDIVHRGLKSSNILVAPSGVKTLRDLGYADVKLTDFGLAKMKVHDLTNPTREKMGTTNWRAPEAFTNDQPIDWKKADAYSFTMTCSEILTGEKPFSSGPLSQLHSRILRRERPVLPSTCPQEVVLLLESCWDTDPNLRPSFTKICEALTVVKENLLKLQWSGQYPHTAHKKGNTLEGPEILDNPWKVTKPWRCGCGSGRFCGLLRRLLWRSHESIPRFPGSPPFPGHDEESGHVELGVTVNERGGSKSASRDVPIDMVLPFYG